MGRENGPNYGLAAGNGSEGHNGVGRHGRALHGSRKTSVKQVPFRIAGCWIHRNVSLPSGPDLELGLVRDRRVVESLSLQ